MLYINNKIHKMTERLFLAYDYNKKMAYGGFHITLIGKGNKMPFNNIKRTSLYNGKKNGLLVVHL